MLFITRNITALTVHGSAAHCKEEDLEDDNDDEDLEKRIVWIVSWSHGGCEGGCSWDSTPRVSRIVQS